VYGSVEPKTGDSFYLTGFQSCNSANMNLYSTEFSKYLGEDTAVLVTDNAAWHHAKSLELPDNIVLAFIPPSTPEMNPIEQIRKEIRKHGFKNEAFATLDKVHDRLGETIKNMSPQTIHSVTGREWILSCQ
jgi:putative transposase